RFRRILRPARHRAVPPNVEVLIGKPWRLNARQDPRDLIPRVVRSCLQAPSAAQASDAGYPFQKLASGIRHTNPNICAGPAAVKLEFMNDVFSPAEERRLFTSPQITLQYFSFDTASASFVPSELDGNESVR